MHKFRVTLLIADGSETILTVSTEDDIISIAKEGNIDQWLDINYPKVKWEKVKTIERIKGNFFQNAKEKMHKYIKKQGYRNKDISIKPTETNFKTNIKF